MGELFVLASQNDMFRINGPIDCENAVEMVNFMLQEFRECPVGFEVFPLAMFVKEFDVDGVIPLYIGEDLRKGETIIPKVELLPAPPHDFRIDQWAGVLAIDIENLLGRANLRGGNASAEAAPRPEFGKGVA